jgi:hypothetical protein
MNFEHRDFDVSTDYLSGLINGDVSGLDDDEALNLEEFEQWAQGQAPEGFRFSHWADMGEDTKDFRICEVCGLLAETETVRAMYAEVTP